VQKILPINGQQGAALRLTTAKYYTPSHEVIHGHGIEPHHNLKMSREDEELLFLQRTPGGLKMVTENRRQAVGNFIDPQLAKAIELLVGKKQIQAKAEPEEEKPNEKATPEKEAEPEAEEKPADKPE
jgi:carboxyl-terminal processing protease